MNTITAAINIIVLINGIYIKCSDSSITSPIVLQSLFIETPALYFLLVRIKEIILTELKCQNSVNSVENIQYIKKLNKELI